jgi:hypothetical protein
MISNNVAKCRKEREESEMIRVFRGVSPEMRSVVNSPYRPTSPEVSTKQLEYHTINYITIPFNNACGSFNCVHIIKSIVNQNDKIKVFGTGSFDELLLKIPKEGMCSTLENLPWVFNKLKKYNDLLKKTSFAPLVCGDSSESEYVVTEQGYLVKKCNGNASDLDLLTLFQEFKGIVNTIMMFVDKGFVHGDLKLQNILYKRSKDPNLVQLYFHDWDGAVFLDWGEIRTVTSTSWISPIVRIINEYGGKQWSDVDFDEVQTALIAYTFINEFSNFISGHKFFQLQIIASLKSMQEKLKNDPNKGDLVKLWYIYSDIYVFGISCMIYALDKNYKKENEIYENGLALLNLYSTGQNFTTNSFVPFGGAWAKVLRPHKIRILGRDRNVVKQGRTKFVRYNNELIKLVDAIKLDKKQSASRVYGLQRSKEHLSQTAE